MGSRRLILISFFIFLTFYGKTQGKLPPNLLSEVSLSINNSFPVNINSVEEIGFGISLHHFFRREKTLKFIVGLEFNQTNQIESITLSKPLPNTTTYITNRKLTAKNISFPFLLRVNFIESFYGYGGYFFDLPFSSESNIHIQASNGPTGGIGTRFQLRGEHLLTIKLGYKKGLKPTYDYVTDVYTEIVYLGIGIEIK